MMGRSMCLFINGDIESGCGGATVAVDGWCQSHPAYPEALPPREDRTGYDR